MKARSMLAMMFTAVLSATAAAQEGKAPAADGAKPIAIEGKDGKSIEAEVLSADEDSVKIRRADGKEFDLPFARLSDAGTAAVRKVLAEKEAEIARLKAEEEEDKKPGVRAKVPEDPKSPEEITEKVVVKKGETVIARFAEAPDGLARPRVVKEAPEDRPYLKVEFKDGDPLIAAITTTSPKTLKVRCLSRNKGETTYNVITILPLKTSVPGFESWSDPIEELVFFDFAFME
ncbi:hypothetical protein OKA05_02665 [Luteolibacter arcticus]|uniref:SLA1 homology domain-containing protein n=1 Tax=Luteolibacter arcticus TaxID=1581411 RepID=A0ABT3GCS6_9BACT|nr:hypothetical protein [Luteolibacter arcticus]MCW1921437.1 hypothetical protein [Luteolibacter arcticus]